MENRKILFLLKNGIGFGHFKRALVIAEKLKIMGCKVTFISQAKSYDIFIGKKFQVFNFPMVEQASSINQQYVFYEMLNSLVELINPDIIIEDTYPDEYYLSLPAVYSKKKLLILRRLNSEGILNYLQTGLFNEYIKILVLSDRDEWVAKQSYRINKLWCSSSKVQFFGDLFDKIKKIDEKKRFDYCNLDERLIVVNCGAGGQQIGKDVVGNLFRHVVSLVPRLQEEFNYKLKFIIVTGPYTELGIDIASSDENNIAIMRYVDDLATLLSISDLNIIRPGYNTTLESLQGGAQTILVPSVSFMEDQLEWCQELEKKYGVDYVYDDDLTVLFDLIVKNLRTKKLAINIKNYAEEVAQTILNLCEKVEALPNNNACFICKEIENFTDHSNNFDTYMKLTNCTYLIDDIKKTDAGEDIISFVSGVGQGVSKFEYQKYYMETLINRIVIEVYWLHTHKYENIISEISTLARKGYRNFYFDDVLTLEQYQKICRELQKINLNILRLDEIIQFEYDKFCGQYSWRPWTPYYRTLK